MDIDSLWASLVSSATIGTGRADFRLPDSDDPALQAMLARIDQSNPQKALLDAAAVVSLYRRAATLPQASARALPLAAPLDPTPRMSETASTLLTRFPSYQEALLRYEWLALAHRTYQRALEEDIPYLLMRCAGDAPSVRGITALVVGKRGRWLAERGEANWQFAAFQLEDDATWHTAKKDTREAFFAALRHHAPQRAYQLLCETWTQETPAQRTIWLNLCLINPSPEEAEQVQAWRDKEATQTVLEAIDRLVISVQGQSAAAKEAYVAEVLAQETQPTGLSEKALAALYACNHAWSDSFSQVFLQHTPQLWKTIDHLRYATNIEALMMLFSHLSPSTLEEARQRIGEAIQSNKVVVVTQFYQRLILLVQLRLEMHHAFGTLIK